LKGGLVDNERDVVSWEKQGFSLLAVVAVVKFVKMQSLDAFFSDLFLYAKAALAALAFVLDVR